MPVTPPARRSRLRLRRHPAWLIGGLLAVCLGGLASAYLFTSAAHTEDVLTMAATVHRGDTITAGDVAVVSLGAGDRLNTVSSAEVNDVIGQTALVDLAQGTLVVTGTYGEDPVPAGVVRVGVRLDAGRYPTGLDSGDEVLVVALPVDGSDAATDEALPSSVPASVGGTPLDQGDGSILVNLYVADTHAESVGRLAAANRLVLVEQGSAP